MLIIWMGGHCNKELLMQVSKMKTSISVPTSVAHEISPLKIKPKTFRPVQLDRSKIFNMNKLR